jgi:hypothetical protein
MDASAVIVFPGPHAVGPGSDLDALADPDDPSPGHAATGQPTDLLERSIAEIDAAIALVAGHAARRVRLAGLPLVDVAAAFGLARALDEGVGFEVERSGPGAPATVTIGPIR